MPWFIQQNIRIKICWPCFTEEILSICCIQQINKYITGFSDAESYFLVSISKNKFQTGWRVKLSFVFNFHIKDQALLEQIKSYFLGVGSLSIQKDMINYTVCIASQLKKN